MHCIYLPDAYAYTDTVASFSTFMHAVSQFDFRNVKILSAESMGGSTPGVRVTWSTTVPPECVAVVRVEFRTSSSRGPVVATYNTTNTSQTEVIQTGLRCNTNYYIRVVVTGKLRPPGGMPATRMLSPRSDVQVLVGGNETVCMQFNQSEQPDAWWLCHCMHRYTYSS